MRKSSINELVAIVTCVENVCRIKPPGKFEFLYNAGHHVVHRKKSGQAATVLQICVLCNVSDYSNAFADYMIDIAVHFHTHTHTHTHTPPGGADPPFPSLSPAAQ
jgi:hypothetical protein